MQNNSSVQVVERFFAVIQMLIEERGELRGVQSFTAKYGINRRNFLSLRKDKCRNIFQVGWLAILVNDYDVNAHWLLTGEGEIWKGFSEKTAK